MREIKKDEEELKKNESSANSSNKMQKADPYDEGEPVHAGFLEDFMEEK